eukprot:4924535-Prymnesium_polylepis.1
MTGPGHATLSGWPPACKGCCWLGLRRPLPWHVVVVRHGGRPPGQLPVQRAVAPDELDEHAGGQEPGRAGPGAAAAGPELRVDGQPHAHLRRRDDERSRVGPRVDVRSQHGRIPTAHRRPAHARGARVPHGSVDRQRDARVRRLVRSLVLAFGHVDPGAAAAAAAAAAATRAAATLVAAFAEASGAAHDTASRKRDRANDGRDR